jgi:hypothetical protein
MTKKYSLGVTLGIIEYCVFIFMLSVIILSIVMLRAVMLSVIYTDWCL